jgi:hypothetical protein
LTHARRTLLAAVVAAAAFLVLGAAPALSANCGRQIIDDWFKDGRVDKVYPLHCYDDALEQLPNDVRTYSDAPQAIKRALQQALAQGAPVDGQGNSGGGSTTPTDTTPEDTTPEDTTPTDTTPTETTPTTPTDGSGGPGDTQALGDESSSASSVPLPLIVLGGLALLLLAAGGAGYLNRRMQASRIDGGPGDPPADL